MPLLLTKKRWPKGQKPNGLLEIDWSNTITRGLVRYWDGKSLVDLTGHVLHNDASSGAIAVTSIKRSEQQIWFDEGTTRTVSEQALTPISSSQNRTFLGEIYNNVGIGAGIFTIGDGTDGNNFERWTVRDGGGGLRIEIQGTGYTSSLGISNGHHFIGCKLDGTQLRDHTFYVDGASQDSGSLTTTVNTSAAYKIRLGGKNLAASATEGIIWGALWNRALSDIEVESIRLNPYQIIKPAQEQVYFITEEVIEPVLSIPSIFFYRQQMEKQ